MTYLMQGLEEIWETSKFLISSETKFRAVKMKQAWIKLEYVFGYASRRWNWE